MMPTRPGNDLDDRPDFLDIAERVIFYTLVPLGAILVGGMILGITVAEVSKWIG